MCYCWFMASPIVQRVRSCGKAHPWCRECKPNTPGMISKGATGRPHFISDDGRRRMKVGRQDKFRSDCIDRFNRWLNGTLVPSNITGSMRDQFVIFYDEKCVLCGFSGSNPTTGRTILEIDHIDGRHTNNSFANLRLLCPNCHAMTSNFRSLNRGHRGVT